MKDKATATPKLRNVIDNHQHVCDAWIYMLSCMKVEVVANKQDFLAHLIDLCITEAESIRQNAPAEGLDVDEVWMV